MFRKSEDELFGKLQKKYVPLFVNFEITSRCNLNCVHCLRARDVSGEMDTREILSVIRQIRDAGCMNLVFTGGEVFTRKDFWTITKAAKGLGFRLILFTNATLMDEKDAVMIKDAGFVEVHVSLYGVDRETHESITMVKGSFEKTMNAVSMLKKKKVPLIIKTVVTKINISGIERVVKFCREKKLKYIISPVIFPKDNGDKSVLDLRISDEELRYLYSVDRDFYGTESWWNAGESGSSALYVCNFGKILCAIGCEGNVYPCITLRKPAGNLRKKPFEHIWKNSELLKELRNLKPKDFKGCFGCGYSRVCQRCPGLAFSENNDILGIDKERCRIMKVLENERGKKEEKVHGS